MANRKYPLEGLKVVELATVVAAPTAGRPLPGFGASDSGFDAAVRAASSFTFRRCIADIIVGIF